MTTWILLLGCGPADTTEPEPPGVIYADEGLDITRESFNDPLWDVAGISLFSAPIGTEADIYAATSETLACLLPNHAYNPAQAPDWLPPIAAHAAPYDEELFGGVEACGFVGDEGLFTTATFDGGVGLVLLFSLVPNEAAPSGRTTDGEDVPMIPDAYFSMAVETDLLIDGSDFHNDLDLDTPYVVDLGMDGTDGLSHWPVHRTYDLGKTPDHVDLVGRWTWSVDVTDAFGAGWRVDVGFDIDE